MNIFSKWKKDDSQLPPIVDELDMTSDGLLKQQQTQQTQTILIFVDLTKLGILETKFVSCQSNISIQQLKKLIQEQFCKNYQDYELCLKYKKQNLINEKTLQDYNIQNQNKIRIKKLKKKQQIVRQQIQLAIKILPTKTILRVKCDQNTKISDIRKCVGQFINIGKYDKIMLQFNGLYLSDNKNLSDYNLKSQPELTAYKITVGGCFPGNALIKLIHGELKQIEDIQLGDMVQSYDDKSDQFLLTKVISKQITKVYKLILIQTQEQNVFCTTNHPFYTQDGWKAYCPDPFSDFQVLNIQDKLLNANKAFHQIIQIKEILYDEGILVYNLTTERPNNYIAYDYIVHNMNKIIIKFDNKQEELEISPNMLIFNIKMLIEKKYQIPLSRQKLYFRDKLLDDDKSLEDYYFVEEDQKRIQIINLEFQLELEIQNQKQQQIQQIKNDIVSLNILINESQFQINIKRKDSILNLKKLIENFDDLWEQESLLICKGKVITNENNNFSVDEIVGNGQNIIVIKPQSGSFCLKFMEELRDIKVLEYQQIKQSLNFIKQDLLNEFLDKSIDDIKNNQTKFQIYQQYQLHHILAIKLWSSNLIYKQLNIDIKNCEYFKWKTYLKCLFDALRYCTYFKGVGYRGIRDYQNLNYYQQGKIVQWTEISGISKNQLIADKFSNQKGMIFQIDLISAKDISQLSNFPEEEEILLLPFSTFKVEDVVNKQNQAIEVKLTELPLPRQPNIILWVDDQPENNQRYAEKVEQENENISIVFCRSTTDALNVVKQYKWMIYLEGSRFRIVTDMVREENCKFNYSAGIDLLIYLFQEIKYKNEVLVFCGDVAKAQETCKNKKIIGSYKITCNQNDLLKFIRFQ